MPRALLLLLLSPVLFPLMGWAALALWFDGPVSRIRAGGLAGIFVLASLAAIALVEPPGLGMAVFGAILGAVLIWWFRLKPRTDRNWRPDVARLPTADIDGELVTVHNLRNFEYRAVNDYTRHWETRQYDLRELRGADLFLSYWGPRSVAHTIVSFEFAGDRYLAISIEIRKPRGRRYSAIRGFFRQFELYYVVGDERDLIRQRTNQRGERVYLYRLSSSVDVVRGVLLEYLDTVNRLAEHPRWYNALISNCTTNIKHHVDQVSPGRPWDWRFFLNGYLDRLAYDQERLDRSRPFAELRALSDITDRARAIGYGPDFSTAIRDGLPDPRRTRSGMMEGRSDPEGAV